MLQADTSILSTDFLTSSQIGQVYALVDKLADRLSQYPIDDYHLDFNFNQSYELNTRLVQVESLEFQEDFSLSIILYKNSKTTSVQCHGLNFGQWISSVETSLQYLDHIDSDPCIGLDQIYDYSQPVPSVEKFFTSPISAADVKSMVLDLESQALSGENIKNSEGAYGQLSYTLNGHRNSKGLNVIVPQSYYCCGVTVVASDEKGQSQVDGSYTGGLELFSQQDIDFVAQQASQRASSRLHRQSVPSGNYPVVLTPRVSSHIFRSLIRAISGQAQYKKASFLLDAKGTKVLPSWMSLNHYPLLSQGHYSFPIDSDGFIAKDKLLVKDGILQDYVLSLYSAKRLNLTSNHLGGGPRNLTATTNAADLNEIVTKFDKCIVIDEVMGTGINIINGDYSMGINGYLYEKGVSSFALKEATVASNLSDMLGNIIFHGQDYKPYKNLRIGSVAIDSMSISCS